MSSLSHLHSWSSDIPEIQQPVEYAGSKVGGPEGQWLLQQDLTMKQKSDFFFIFCGSDIVTISQSQWSFNSTLFYVW